jgi:hypothetical protein
MSLLQELLVSVGFLEFPGGKAQISDVSKCVGDVSFSPNILLSQCNERISSVPNF